MPIKGKILGIDYGNARIGIAISDFDQEIAFPKDTLQNTSLNKVILEIHEICTNEKVVEIVLGMPYSMNGKISEQTEKTLKFLALLKKNLSVPVEIHDERLTSIESDVILTTLNMRGEERKNSRDKIAASLILKNYLDYKRSNREKGGKKGELSLKKH